MPAADDIPIPEIPGWSIVRPIGRGGMGCVYEAVSRTVDRPMALKVIDASLAANPDFKRYFLREIRTTVGLRHPHILPILNYAPDPDAEIVYLATPLVGEDGCRSLADLLATRGRLEPAAAAQLLGQVCDALAYAHQIRPAVVHRDISPGNILLNRDDAGGFDVLLADFGIAYPADESDRSAFTRTDGVAPSAGKPQYMAPEQFDEEAFGPITPATDLYQLGVVAHQCVTGTPPFQETSPVRYGDRHRFDPPPPLTETSCPDAAMRTLIARLLSKQPTDRPTAAETQAVFDAVASGPGSGGGTVVLAAPPRTVVQMEQRTVTRRPGNRRGLRVLLGVGVVFITLVVGGIGIWYTLQQSGSPVEPSPADDETTKPTDDGAGADGDRTTQPPTNPDGATDDGNNDEPAQPDDDTPETNDDGTERSGTPDDGADEPPPDGPIDPEPLPVLEAGERRRAWLAAVAALTPTQREQVAPLVVGAQTFWSFAEQAREERDEAAMLSHVAAAEQAYATALQSWRAEAPRTLQLVVDASAVPALPLAVQVTRGGWTVRTLTVDAAGTVAVPKLEAGAYELVIMTSDDLVRWPARQVDLGDAALPPFPGVEPLDIPIVVSAADAALLEAAGELAAAQAQLREARAVLDEEVATVKASAERGEQLAEEARRMLRESGRTAAYLRKLEELNRNYETWKESHVASGAALETIESALTGAEQLTAGLPDADAVLQAELIDVDSWQSVIREARAQLAENPPRDLRP
jgi:hypothetical protein